MLLRAGLLSLSVALFVSLASQYVVGAKHPDLRASGSLLTLQDEPFTGVLVGFHRPWRPALIASYRDGKRHGREFSWHENGVLASDRSYRAGVYNGRSETWYPNGRIKTYREYNEGLAEGEQWSWGEDGQVLEFNLYKNDLEIAHKTWTFDGKPYHNYVYQNGEKVGILGEPFCKRRKRF